VLSLSGGRGILVGGDNGAITGFSGARTGFSGVGKTSWRGGREMAGREEAAAAWLLSDSRMTSISLDSLQAPLCF